MTHLVVPSPTLTLVAPEGVSSLPLVELDEAKVRAERRHIQLREGSKKRREADCSYGDFGRSLRFNAWELCHAAKKTELTRTFTQQQVDTLGILFANEHHSRFVWDTENLRCSDGSGMWLEDFSGTGLAGRVGEALAYLAMVKLWGYIYWDRIASVWLRTARSAQIEHRDMIQVARYTGNLVGNLPSLQPDFIFEKPDRTLSLMEAKGSFVTPGNSRPNVKKTLKHGLEQLDAWATLITPAPSNSIAIGSLLREASDPCDDPSLMVHVDPPPTGRPIIDPIVLPPDGVRRANYGAWLGQMGFRGSGSALADGRQVETRPIVLPVVTLNGRDFALSTQGWCVDRRWPRLFPWWHFELLEDIPPGIRIDLMRDAGVTGLFVSGLEVTILRAVSDVLRMAASQALTELQPIVDLDSREGRQPEGFYGSVMPDGSLLGIVSSNLFDRKLRTETFAL